MPVCDGFVAAFFNFRVFLVDFVAKKLDRNAKKIVKYNVKALTETTKAQRKPLRTLRLCEKLRKYTDLP